MTKAELQACAEVQSQCKVQGIFTDLPMLPLRSCNECQVGSCRLPLFAKELQWCVCTELFLSDISNQQMCSVSHGTGWPASIGKRDRDRDTRCESGPPVGSSVGLGAIGSQPRNDGSSSNQGANETSRENVRNTSSSNDHETNSQSPSSSGMSTPDLQKSLKASMAGWKKLGITFSVFAVLSFVLAIGFAYFACRSEEEAVEVPPGIVGNKPPPRRYLEAIATCASALGTVGSMIVATIALLKKVDG